VSDYANTRGRTVAHEVVAVSRWGYFARRVLLSIPVVVFAMTFTFVAIRMGPLDPVAAIIGPQGDPQAYARIERSLGLNEPLWEQYIDFMTGLFTLNFADSYVVSENRNAMDVILQFAPKTIWLGTFSIGIAILVGIPLGFYAGLNPNTPGDYVASLGGIIWRAMPNFWLGVMLIAVLIQSDKYLGIPGVWTLDWSNWIVRTATIGTPPMQFFEITQRVSGIPVQFDIKFQNLLKATKVTLPPAAVLGSASMGNEMRIGRTAVLETINSKYVETARAKGVPSRIIVWKHVFRNAMIPLIPIISNEALLLVGGSVIVEQVFQFKGLGYIFFQALSAGDLPLIGALMFVFVIFLVFLNILQDLLYTVVDPRVGYET
jgi:peptide/nickel transport system permease protein